MFNCVSLNGLNLHFNNFSVESLIICNCVQKNESGIFDVRTPISYQVSL